MTLLSLYKYMCCFIPYISLCSVVLLLSTTIFGAHFITFYRMGGKVLLQLQCVPAQFVCHPLYVLGLASGRRKFQRPSYKAVAFGWSVASRRISGRCGFLEYRIGFAKSISTQPYGTPAIPYITLIVTKNVLSCLRNALTVTFHVR